MYASESSIVINRPIDDVFDYVENPANNVEWQSGIESSELTSDGPRGVGSTSKQVRSFLGRKVEATLEVTGWDPPNRASARAVGGPIPFESTYVLEEQGDGTQLTVMIQAEFGGFFKLAEGLVGKQLEKQIVSDLAALKLLLENGQV